MPFKVKASPTVKLPSIRSSTCDGYENCLPYISAPWRLEIIHSDAPWLSILCMKNIKHLFGGPFTHSLIHDKLLLENSNNLSHRIHHILCCITHLTWAVTASSSSLTSVQASTEMSYGSSSVHTSWRMRYAHSTLPHPLTSNIALWPHLLPFV